uniref:Uncharacterized protein n=2 Tax=Zea mays TaxID=4577 RepID=A0A804LMA3_MAIZE
MHCSLSPLPAYEPAFDWENERSLIFGQRVPESIPAISNSGFKITVKVLSLSFQAGLVECLRENDCCRIFCGDHPPDKQKQGVKITLDVVVLKHPSVENSIRGMQLLCCEVVEKTDAVMCFNAFDEEADLDVLDHPVLNLFYYLLVEILPSSLVLYILRRIPAKLRLSHSGALLQRSCYSVYPWITFPDSLSTLNLPEQSTNPISVSADGEGGNVSEKQTQKDPEKLRREREELERVQREERARLQAEAKAAEDVRKRAKAAAADEAAAEAKRQRELEREAARKALQEMEKTIDINEGSHFLKDLEMLGSVTGEQIPNLVGETSPGFQMGSNTLEKLGLYVKNDEDDEDGDFTDEPVADVEEGEIARQVRYERPLELLAKAYAINSFDIDPQNPSDVVFTLEWEPIGVLPCGEKKDNFYYQASEWVKGKQVEEVVAIKNTEIAKHLSLPPVKLHCSMLAEDAIKAAVKDYEAKKGKKMAKAEEQDTPCP